jgi:hypothetical protein
MTLQDRHDFNAQFHRRLAQLRSQIDSVSAEERSVLCQMANQVEQQHRQTQDDCAIACNLTEDMSLSVASTMFNIWACQREAEQICSWTANQ